MYCLGLGDGVEFVGHAAGGGVILFIARQETHQLLKILG